MFDHAGPRTPGRSPLGRLGSMAFPTTVHASGRRSPGQSYSGLKLPTGRVPGLVPLRRTRQDAVRQQAVQEGGGGPSISLVSVCIVLIDPAIIWDAVLYINIAASAQHPPVVLCASTLKLTFHRLYCSTMRSCAGFWRTTRSASSCTPTTLAPGSSWTSDGCVLCFLWARLLQACKYELVCCCAALRF